MKPGVIDRHKPAKQSRATNDVERKNMTTKNLKIPAPGYEYHRNRIVRQNPEDSALRDFSLQYLVDGGLGEVKLGGDLALRLPSLRELHHPWSLPIRGTVAGTLPEGYPTTPPSTSVLPHQLNPSVHGL